MTDNKIDMDILKELETMGKMNAALNELESVEAKSRALNWLMRKTADELVRLAQELRDKEEKYREEKMKKAAANDFRR